MVDFLMRFFSISIEIFHFLVTSGSETEPIGHKQHLEKLKESRQRYGKDWLIKQSSIEINIEDDPTTRIDEEEITSIEIQSRSIGNKLTPDLSQVILLH